MGNHNFQDGKKSAYYYNSYNGKVVLIKNYLLPILKTKEGSKFYHIHELSCTQLADRFSFINTKYHTVWYF